jgi:hypothetical protein
MLPMLLERLPKAQSLAPEDKWRLIDELWRDSSTPPGQRRTLSSCSNSVLRLTWPTLPRRDRRTRFSQGWRSVNAGGSNLSGRCGSRPVCGVGALRRALPGLGDRFDAEVRVGLARSLELPNPARFTPENSAGGWCAASSTGFLTESMRARIVVRAVLDLRQDPTKIRERLDL